MLVLDPDSPNPNNRPKSLFGDRSGIANGLSLLELPNNVAVLLKQFCRIRGGF